MAFEEARKYLEKHFERRFEDLRDGKRLRWSVSDEQSLSKHLEKFGRDSEQQEWQGVHKQKQPDMHQLMGVSNKIAFLCGCARDIRMQFTAARGDAVRTSVDHTRFEISYLEWKKKAMKRLKELMDIRKKKL